MTDEKIITQDGAILPPEDEVEETLDEQLNEMADVAYEEQFEEKIASTSDTRAILDAVKELTTAVTDMVKITNAMKASHDKWVRAGKF